MTVFPDVPSRAWHKLEELLAWARITPAAGEQVLEIGCAPGGATVALLDRGLRVVGVDPQPVVLPPRLADAQFNVPIDVAVPFKLAKQNVINEFERRYIAKLLSQHDGNISAAARAAGIDRMSIHKMLHRLGLTNSTREE